MRISDGEKPRWENPVLTRFFKRIGTVPAGHTTSQAALRTLLAVREMAQKGGVSPERVYADLTAFCGQNCESGLCTDSPQCTRCPVSQHCKFASRTPTIKDLPPGERPRERLLANGPETLSNAELLAILIGGGSSRESALAIARRMLATFGGLKEISNAGNSQLEKINGVGKAKIARLRAAFEMATRLYSHPLQPGMSIDGSKQVFQHYRERMRKLKKEEFLCLLLDTRLNVIREEKIAIGSLNETVVHPREVFRTAVNESAHAVIFIHNHPSGDPSPSPQDKNLTERLQKAGELMGIEVVDHVIIGHDNYYSFAEHRQL
jgi:DNA repair protein RadC